MNRPPSVDQLARSIAELGLAHPLAVAVAREAVATNQVDRIEEMALRRKRRMLGPVINATGVLLHTNMGRAPLAHIQQADYQNLELDLETGARGSRQSAVGDALATLVGAEAAMVVNNCASAVMLALAALAGPDLSGDKRATPKAGAPDADATSGAGGSYGAGVAVSRGEMVEIGGAFRVPDVMAQSGAELVEVGTTNRTRLADYQTAVEYNGATMVLKVHQSNYRIVGFTEETSVAELATLGVPVLVDIGSGLIDSTCSWLDGPPPPWLSDEPAARQTLAAGASLVTFSGDKLFGGPQAGVIAGGRDLVTTCARHPLARALRPGSLVLSALQATTDAYLRRDGDAIPFWKMATISIQELRSRAEAIVRAGEASLNERSPQGASSLQLQVMETEAAPGGGTLPTVKIPSFGIAIEGDHLTTLRNRSTPIVARVAQGRTVLDLRSVSPQQDSALAAAIGDLAGNPTPPAGNSRQSAQSALGQSGQ